MKIVAVWAVDPVLLVRLLFGIFSFSSDLLCGFDKSEEKLKIPNKSLTSNTGSTAHTATIFIKSL